MIEHPAIGAKSQIELKENMIFSLHPQVVDQDGKFAYTRRTPSAWAKPRAKTSARIPWKFYSHADARTVRRSRVSDRWIDA